LKRKSRVDQEWGDNGQQAHISWISWVWIWDKDMDFVTEEATWYWPFCKGDRTAGCMALVAIVVERE